MAGNSGTVGLPPGLPWWLSWQRIHLQCGRPRGGNGYPLQYSGLENCMNSPVHRVTKSWTQLRDFHFPLLMSEFHSKSAFVSPICLKVQQRQPRYPTDTIGYIVLYCNGFIIIFTQRIHIKQTQNFFLILTVQHLEKYSNMVQRLASRGWHQVNRQEELLIEGEGEGGRW